MSSKGKKCELKGNKCINIFGCNMLQRLGWVYENLLGRLRVGKKIYWVHYREGGMSDVVQDKKLFLSVEMNSETRSLNYIYYGLQ